MGLFWAVGDCMGLYGGCMGLYMAVWAVGDFRGL